MTAPALRVVSYGRPATIALRAAIDAAKAGHPLDPVTVIVSSNLAGLSARRLVGGGTVGAGGIANVSFVTPYRLAELVGGEHVTGYPLTNAVLAAAAREVLREEPGWFRKVAEHHASESALIALYAELSHARPATLEALADRGGRSGEVVRLFRAMRRRLTGFHDEDDLASAAADRLAADPHVAAALGAVIWFLPDRTTAAMGALVGAILRVAPATLVVGRTGDAKADTAVLAACGLAGVDLAGAGVGAVGPAAASPPTGTRIVSVSDADEEVRAVGREIAALAEAGVPFDRIGVFHPTPDPYARALHEQLQGAGIAHNGPSRLRLADRVAGRTLLAVLGLPDKQWSRAAVVAVAADGPVRHQGEAAPAGAWDNLSRRAGVVGGRDDWLSKLADFAADQRLAAGQVAADDSQPAWIAEQRAVDAALADRLAAFVETLTAAVDTVDRATGWGDKSRAARTLLEQLLGSEGRRTAWPDAERSASERVDAALARLDLLDEIEPDPSTGAFVRAVAAELDEPAGRVGRFGEGLVFGPLAMAPGLDLDAVFLVGMAEGSCPARRREDALLPDEDRDTTGDDLVSRDDQLHDQHRHFLAALSAGRRQRVLVFPRGDLRGSRERLPSRWLLDTASVLAGERVHSSGFANLADDAVTVVQSFSQGLAAAPAALSAVDHALMALAPYVREGGDPATHPAATVAMRRGFAMIAGRRSHEFTAWDGNLAGRAVPSPAGGKVLSATALQSWAKCPFQYFLARVLRLGERPEPESVTKIAASDQGLLIHEILERFVGEAISEPDRLPAFDQPWTAAHRARLRAIADEVFERFEAEEKTGRPLTWTLTRQFVLADLDVFLASDNGYRAATHAQPVRVELPFGLDGADPVVLDLGDGRRLRLRGRADRVDATASGRHIVLDYKTGKPDAYKKLDEDPVLRGNTLQLGLYAEAARAQLGADEVDSYYWMISSRGGFKRYGYPWTDDRRRRFLDVVGAIVDGVESGTFPARSGPYGTFFGSHDNCTHCDFDRLCPRDRDDHERAKAGAPEMAVLQRLEVPDAGVEEVPESGGERS